MSSTAAGVYVHVCVYVYVYCLDGGQVGPPTPPEGASVDRSDAARSQVPCLTATHLSLSLSPGSVECLVPLSSIGPLLLSIPSLLSSIPPLLSSIPSLLSSIRPLLSSIPCCRVCLTARDRR